MENAELYIGLMSGTSVDGIDAALVDFSNTEPVILATQYHAYPAALREKILSLCLPGENEIQRLGELDIILGKEFAAAAQSLLKNIPAASIKAIGSHGQTVRHFPHPPHSFTLQIGDPNTIAAITGITTVADFRRRDIALGGQGAPLVPAFHQQMFADKKINRAIVNIGGIANITILSTDTKKPIIGFDSGPGNTLLDAWMTLHQNETYDRDGSWGKSGNSHALLLNQLLADPYFQQSAPKSTGREYFHLAWLEKNLAAVDVTLASADVQATLAELTVTSIMSSITEHLKDGEILVCGGGVHNALMMERLKTLAAPHFSVESTHKYGIAPDWVEAMAFAWLARQTMNHQPGNLPSVTGARQSTILGGVYFA